MVYQYFFTRADADAACVRLCGDGYSIIHVRELAHHETLWGETKFEVAFR